MNAKASCWQCGEQQDLLLTFSMVELYFGGSRLILFMDVELNDQQIMIMFTFLLATTRLCVYNLNLNMKIIADQ